MPRATCLSAVARLRIQPMAMYNGMDTLLEMSAPKTNELIKKRSSARVERELVFRVTFAALVKTTPNRNMKTTKPKCDINPITARLPLM